MYVNKETKKPAFLRAQDGDGVTYSDGGHRHTIPSHEFFGAWREATAAEILHHDREVAAAKGVHTRQANAAAAAKPKPKAAPKAARAARTPPAARAAMQQGARAEPAPAPSAAPPKPHVTVEPLK